MKRLPALWIAVAVVCLILIIALPMWFLGPYFHINKKTRLLSSLRLPDKSCIYLVQRWNETVGEPYSVILYRLHTNGVAESTLIGFEEAYWWSGTLSQKDSKTVNVINDREIICSYNIKTGEEILPDGSSAYRANQDDYTHISNELWAINHKLYLPQESP